MTFDEYQANAMRTKNRGELDAVLAPHLAVAGLGLAGEAGEVADEIKKIVGHGKAMDKPKLLKELGDVLWYAASLADELGVRLADVAQANIDKLKARYPAGFSTAASVAKADEVPEPIGSTLKPHQSAAIADLKRRIMAGESVTITVPAGLGKTCGCGPELVPMCDGELVEVPSNGERG